MPNDVITSSVVPVAPVSPQVVAPDLGEGDVQAAMVQYAYELPPKKKRRRPVSHLRVRSMSSWTYMSLPLNFKNITFEGFEEVEVLIEEVEESARGMSVCVCVCVCVHVCVCVCVCV